MNNFYLFNIPLTNANSIWQESSDSNFINGSFYNISIIKNFNESELRLQLNDRYEWFQVLPDNSPGKRDEHAMAYIWGTDKVLLFGGYSQFQTSSYNDTWIFDLSDNNWIEKYPINIPPGRRQHMMSPIIGTDKVILFGGASNGSDENSTWIYDLSENNWTNMKPVRHPEARTYSAMTPILNTDKVFIFGGYSSKYFNDSWIYDFSENNWTKMNPQGLVPDARRFFDIISIYGSNDILLYGGTYFDGVSTIYYNDSWKYNYLENIWTKISCPTNPSAVWGHKMALIHNLSKVILFGGLTGPSMITYEKETWIFNNNNHTWLNISSKDEIGFREHHAISSIYGSDKILLFGGWNGSNYLNKTWIFDVLQYSSNGIYISSPKFISNNFSYKKIKWLANNTTNTDVKFQLRSGSNEQNLLSKKFIGSDGTDSSYYNTSGEIIWYGHENNSYIQLKAYLSTVNLDETPKLKDIIITYNNWPITSLKQPIDGSYLINNRPLFKWNFSDIDSTLQTEFQLVIDDNSQFLNIDFDSGEQITNNSYWQFPNGTNYSKLSDGIWYWKVRTKDNDGDWGLNSTPYKLIIDTGIPSTKIIKPKDNTFYGFIDVISGIADDPPNGTGLKKVELQIEDLNLKKFWDGSAWTSSENWLISNGKEVWSYDTGKIGWTSGTIYRIHSRAVDTAGNIESPAQTKEFTFDNERVMFSKPIPEIHQISNQEEVLVGITISDNTSGVNASTIKYSISTDASKYWSPWKTVEGYSNGNNVDVNLNLTFPNGTDNRIRWRAYDIAGNGPTYSDEYIINVNIPTPPVIPEIQLLSPANNSNLITTKVELSWEVIENYHPGIIFDIKLGTQNPPQDFIENNFTNTKLNIDDLENDQTYYWTVIPRLNNINGTCISGIWSFTVDIPLPRAILKTPENNSIMTSTLPTLVWSLDYEGTDTITYDLYFGPRKNTLLEFKKLTTTYFGINNALEDNTTHFWYVVPHVGKYEGFSSEIWSFTVKLKDEQIPEFGIELNLNPNPLEIKPGEVKFVSAIVNNLGNMNDNFTVTIGDINNTKLTAENYQQDTLEIPPGKNKEFLIMISIEENTKPGFENITVIATSRLAEKYNLDVKDSQVLTIKILEKDDQKGKENGQPISIFYFSILLLIIILIIISIIILIIVRKKASKKESEVVKSQKIIPETLTENITTPEPRPVPIQGLDETQEE